MKKFTLSLITLFLIITFTLFLFEPKSHAATTIDDNYLIARAIVLAGFTDSDQPTIPQISYLMPGEQPAKENIFNFSERIVTIFDARLGIGGIQAKFIAPKYTIQDGGETLTFSSFKKTVGDILQENGAVLANEDQVTPPADQSPADNKILITRVSVAEIDEFLALPYQTKTVDDPTLERGKKVVEQVGRDGKKKLAYQVRRENGVEVSRSLIGETIELEPQTKIIKNGTKVVVLSSISGEASWTNGVTAMRKYKRGVTIKVTNLANGKSVITTVGGWGPQEYTGRILDLARADFGAIADIGSGTANVLVEELNN